MATVLGRAVGLPRIKDRRAHRGDSILVRIRIGNEGHVVIATHWVPGGRKASHRVHAVYLLHDALGPLYCRCEHLVGSGATLRPTEQTVCRVEMPRHEDRSHDPEHSFAALVSKCNWSSTATTSSPVSAFCHI